MGSLQKHNEKRNLFFDAFTASMMTQELEVRPPKQVRDIAFALVRRAKRIAIETETVIHDILDWYQDICDFIPASEDFDSDELAETFIGLWDNTHTPEGSNAILKALAKAAQLDLHVPPGHWVSQKQKALAAEVWRLAHCLACDRLFFLSVRTTAEALKVQTKTAQLTLQALVRNQVFKVVAEPDKNKRKATAFFLAKPYPVQLRLLDR